MHDDEAGATIIAELEERRYQAMLRADVATLEGMLADDVVYTHSSAERDTKAAYLEKISTGQLRYLRITRTEERIVMAGETAIVAGRMAADVEVRGSGKHLNTRCIAVWTNHQGRWRLLAFQGTSIPSP